MQAKDTDIAWNPYLFLRKKWINLKMTRQKHSAYDVSFLCYLNEGYK